jgi:hypothetical protein
MLKSEVKTRQKSRIWRLIALLTSAFSLLPSALSLPNPCYFADNNLGAGTGADAADAIGLASIEGGDVGNNTTLIAAGIITGQLYISASGLTVEIPAGTGFSSPAGWGSGSPWPAIYIAASVNGLTVDGQAPRGQNGNGGGFIRCTANGTALANQTAVYAIYAQDGAGGISVKNLALTNSYVDSAITDSTEFSDSAGAFYGGSLGGSNFFGNLYLSNNCTAIQAGGASCTCVYSNCTFVNYNHGLFPSSDTTLIEDCFFGSSANWDQEDDNYHHDGIIWSGGDPSTSFIISACTFDGNMGNYNTAYFYNDEGYASVYTCENSLFIVQNHLGDGAYVGGGNLFNDTFVSLDGNDQETAFTAGGYNNVQNCIFDGFGNFLLYEGSVFGSHASNNIYANQLGGVSFNITGTNYTSFVSYTNATHDGQSQYIASTSTLVNTATGAVSSGSPAIGAGNTFVYSAYGITNDLAGNARSPNVMDIGAFAAFIPGLNYNVIFTTP